MFAYYTALYFPTIESSHTFPYKPLTGAFLPSLVPGSIWSAFVHKTSHLEFSVIIQRPKKSSTILTLIAVILPIRLKTRWLPILNFPLLFGGQYSLIVLAFVKVRINIRYPGVSQCRLFLLIYISGSLGPYLTHQYDPQWLAVNLSNTQPPLKAWLSLYNHLSQGILLLILVSW